MVQDDLPPQLLDDMADDLDVVKRNFSRNIQETFLKWAIRWMIGFGLIWAVTAATGRFSWLWSLGIIVALASLAFNVGANFLLRQRLRQARDTRDKLGDAFAEATQDNH